MDYRPQELNRKIAEVHFLFCNGRSSRNVSGDKGEAVIEVRVEVGDAEVEA
jgi:hypothetical protein